MARMYQLFLVIALICLVVMGLNISNQGINHLTMQNKGPVIGLNVDNKNISLQFLSEKYSYSGDKIVDMQLPLLQESKELVHRGTSYISSIWTIFEAIYL